MTSKSSIWGREPTRERAWRELRYQSARKPKLRAAALVVPPPIPAVAVQQDEGGGFGPPAQGAEPDEVGLRVLAALESLPSLEPDYCGDLAAEASVTIIERADSGGREPGAEAHHADDHGSLRARLDDMGEAPDIVPDEYAAYQGPIEEAVVEIVERPADDGQNAASERMAVDFPAHEPFSKARSGGSRT